MFVLKQFLKALLLPPMPWLLMLLTVLIFWHKSWARKLLLITFLLILALHSGSVNYALRYPLESRHPPLLDPRKAGPYDAIVVLTASMVPASGLIPFPTVDESMFRRLEEAWRLYRIQPKPIIVSGGHVNPFTADQDEYKIARDYLLRWGIPAASVIGEDQSRDTFESAVEVEKLLKKRGWKRYLLVTSAIHMPRSLLVFSVLTPTPIAAPGDFSLSEFELTPFDFFPNEQVARKLFVTIHEYLGFANYYWRMHYANP